MWQVMFLHDNPAALDFVGAAITLVSVATLTYVQTKRRNFFKTSSAANGASAGGEGELDRSVDSLSAPDQVRARLLANEGEAESDYQLFEGREDL